MSTYSQYEYLARHLEPHFGDIYELGVRWTDELRAAARSFLMHELPADVCNWLLDPTTGKQLSAATKSTRIDALVRDAYEPLDLGCFVRTAAVSAVPTFEQLIGDFDSWPSEEDSQDAATWLHVHADESIWKELAQASGHLELLPVVELVGNQHDPAPDDLVNALTPPELLAAWRTVTTPEPSKSANTKKEPYRRRRKTGAADVNPVLRSALKVVAHWCVQTIPESEETRQRLTAKPKGSAITIYAAHIPSDPEEGSDWIIEPFAQLRYDHAAGSSHAWSLYFPNLDDEWQEYGTDGFSGPLPVLLDEIEEDPFGVFEWIDQVG